MKALASVISIIGLYLGYWIGKSIYLSFLDGSATVGSSIQAEWIIAGVVCGIICLINCIVFQSSAEFTIAIVFVLCFIAFRMPYSIGFVVLFNLVMIGSILTSIWKK
jgi:hypothetical protein